jgi:hypothetical protein
VGEEGGLHRESGPLGTDYNAAVSRAETILLLPLMLGEPAATLPLRHRHPPPLQLEH